MATIGRIAIFRIFFSFCGLSLLLSGCIPPSPKLTGPQFEFKENVHHQLAQIYIYRQVSPPTMRSPEIWVNEKKFFDLVAGGFAKVFVASGETTIETRWNWDTGVENKLLSFMAEPGNTYFVKCHTDLWAFSFHSTLKVVPELIALYELESLQEIEISSD